MAIAPCLLDDFRCDDEETIVNSSCCEYDDSDFAMSTKPTANWDRVGNHFYRKVQLYTEIFDQDLELENYSIAGAPYSGAVGMRMA